MTSIYAHLEKPSMVDFPKKFAAVFFTSGCNFSCGFCHNAELMSKKKRGLSWESLEEICSNFKKQWVNGVVITGGEPMLADDLVELIRFFKSFGFAVKLDTNGAFPEQLARCLPLLDYVAMDLKTGPSGYQELVGFSDIQKIKESIDLIKANAKDYEFRTTVIETWHSDDLMDEAAELIHGAKRYVLQAFIPRDELPDPRFCSLPRTTSARLHELKARLESRAGEIIVRGA